MPKKNQFSEEVIQTALFAKAMSHPVRVFILKKLSKMGTCCYSGDLVEELPIGRSSLSQHLKELKMAGLIQGETEPPFIKYCLNRQNWNIAQQMFHHLLED
ncbi:MAG: transcriptional regulator [Bacteroidetes bacterium]|nr:transcriptional regulator [Bacteroidota bacterium]